MPTVLPSTQQQLTFMNMPSRSVNPFNSTTIAPHTSYKAKEDDGIDVMPASVEDHFAKALGDQWSKLNSNSTVPPSPNTAIS